VPIFACDECGCLENTALSLYWVRERGSKALCSQCDPAIGCWHGRFPRRQWNGDPTGICNKDLTSLVIYLGGSVVGDQ